MITGIPPYKPPVEQGVRCACRRYYVVVTTEGLEGLRAGSPSPQTAEIAVLEAARERAERWGATFVDARVMPFTQCECGEVLEFVESAGVVH